MKIQLKRSNVVENSAAKVPTAEQMDYGELAVNYNVSDPCIFLKDSNNQIVRIAGAGYKGEFTGDYNDLINTPTIGNGDIVISAGNGLSATGDNATANQTGSTNRTLSVLAANSTINVTGSGISVNNAAISPEYGNISGAPTIGNGSININAGNGLSASGDNAKANQTGTTTRTLSAVAANSTISVSSSGIAVNNSEIAPEYGNISGRPTIGNGAIQVNAGNGLSASGNNATANQTGTTTRTLSAKAANSTISVSSSGIAVNNGNITPEWDNIQNKPSDLGTGAALSSGSYITGGPYDGSAAKTFSAQASTTGEASRLVATNSNGDIRCRYAVTSYVNMSHTASTRSSDTIFYSSTDDYVRKNNASGMRAALNVPTRTGGNASGTWAINITGNAATATSASSATNADKLDNIDSSQFLRSDAADQKTNGTLRFNDSVMCTFGSSDDCEFFCNGSHMYMDLNSGIGNFYIRDGSTNRFTFDDDGHFTASGNVTAYSDITLKDNIEVIPNALDKVSKVRGVTYNRNDMEDNPRQAGVIAQEIEEVLPEVISTNEEGIKSVAYGNLVGLLIEAIKELKAEVETLKKGVN